MNQTEQGSGQSENNRRSAFLRLYQANELRIYGFIRSVVPDWSAADDIMQDTTTVLWSKFEQFEIGTDFVSWAICIARYEVLGHLKKKRTAKLRFSSQTVEAIADRVMETIEKTDARRDALRHCMGKLKEKDRKLVHMRYEIGATTQSVAKRIGRSISTVYKSLNDIHIQLLRCIRRTLELEK